MNKHLYRLVFNARRGLLMAVAETVCAHADAGRRQCRPRAFRPVLRGARLATLAVALAPGALAQIVAYRNAPAPQQATILKTGNGVPLVNIQTPSAAGISHNAYSQFDVQASGAIVNNSRRATPTQLAGWVQGNPWLAGGGARLIVNEIVSSNPSRLNGYIEVAGSGAQLVIANPAGISCAGCGFINVPRLMLSSGVPRLSHGNLDGYRVVGGTISVDGGGMDASRVSHTELIARAVKINAGLWAQALAVTTGANDVDVASTSARAIAAAGAAPAYALDVAALGGMYAGKITLVGSEAGVGVRNAGVIAASAGDVVVTADGHLHNSGQLASTAQTTLRSGGVENSGTIYAQGDMLVAVRAAIDNRGVIAARGHSTLAAAADGGHIGGGALALFAAGLDANGVLAGNSRLTLAAERQIALHGQAIASGEVLLSAASLALSDSRLSAETLTLNATRGDLDARRAHLVAGATLRAAVAQTLVHDQASSQAQRLQIAARAISNSHGELAQSGDADLAIALAGSFNNAQGRLASNSRNILLTAQDIDNSDGAIIHAGGGTLTLAASTLDNRGGSLTTNGRATLMLGDLDNRAGRLAAAGNSPLTLSARGVVDNAGGYLGGGDIALTAQSVSNAGGQISAPQTLAIAVRQSVENNHGSLIANGQLTLSANGIDNQRGTIAAAHGSLSADSGRGALDNSAGFVGAKGPLTLVGAAIVNSSGGSVSSEQGVTVSAQRVDNRGGQIGALGALAVSAGESIDNRSGVLRSGQALSLSAPSITNDGRVDGQALAVNAQHLDNRGGALRANETLVVVSNGTVDNRGGVVAAVGQVEIVDPRAIAGANSTVKTLAVDNDGGTLSADRQLTVDSASLSGGGALLSGGDLAIRVRGDFTPSGEVVANGNATLETAATLSNRARLQAGAELTLKAATLDNEAGGEIVGATLRLSATSAHTLSNRGLIDGGQVLIDSPTINNLGAGRIYGDHLAISAHALSNTAEAGAAPVIAARDRLDIGAATIDNSEHAQLFSAGDLAIGGALDTSQHASGQAAVLNNRSATIEALGSLTISAGEINNTNAHLATAVRALAAEQRVEYQGSGASARYAPGSAGVYVFNDESDQLMTPEGKYESWLRYDYTRSASETQLIGSDPGRIVAGGAIELVANTVVNSDSQIIAGGTLSAQVGTLANRETSAERTISDRGSVTSFWRNHRKGRDNTGSSVAEYSPPPTIASISLGTAVYRQNQVLGERGTPPDRLTIMPLQRNAGGVEAAKPIIGPEPTRNTPLDLQVPALSAVVTGAPTMVIRRVTPNITLPDNALFRTVAAPVTSRYLIETDAQFTRFRQWLSSDYLISALAGDPATSQQRLGDGFYEQRLIREQVAQLTGQRFLAGYVSDEAQFRALMDSAVAYAERWRLIPGVALAAEQMAQLTSDIVWLVERSVTLADGTVQKVLAPQVYVRLRDGESVPGSALIAARNVDLALGGDLDNRATIAGRELVTIRAENIGNLGGRIGGDVTLLRARNDLANIGGALHAENRLLLSAGRDLTVASTTRSQSNAQGSRTAIDRVAGLTVGVDGTLVASAGRDLTLLGAVVGNAAAASGADTGSILLRAGNDLKLGTVSQSARQSIVWDGQNWRRDRVGSDVGSTLRSGGDLALYAGRDVDAVAANVSSERGTLSVLAGGRVSISAGEASRAVDEAHRQRENGFLWSKTRSRRDSVAATSAVASTLSGNSTTLNAGNDLLIKGSNVVASGDTLLSAGKDVGVEAAPTTRQEVHFDEVRQSGVFGSGGVGFTIGSRQLSTEQTSEGRGVSTSLVGSTHGDVLVRAGGAYRQVGSELIAAQGSIDIAAKSVDIVEAREAWRSVVETRAKQAGLTVAISSPVIAAVQTVQQMSDAARQTDDPRMKLLAAASSALAVSNAAAGVLTGQGTTIDGKPNQMPTYDAQGKVVGSREATAGERVGGVNLLLSMGGSSSHSATTQSSDSAAASTLSAGQDVRLSARGGANTSDLTLQGARISAGRDIALAADDELRLLAASNKAEQHSSKQSRSAAVGFSTGTDGLLFNIGASAARGHADGADTLWSNSELTAGRRLTLAAGGDATLRGALVSAEQVVAKVGGDLVVESLRDTSNYASKQQSAGFTLSAGYGKASGSVSASRSTIDSNYVSVVEPSGIRAGDGGFQVAVAGDTRLAGALIASTPAAVDQQRNAFSTGGTLTLADLENRADYRADSVGINIGSAASFAGRANVATLGTGAGLGRASAEAGSTTRSGISGIAGDTAVRSTDAASGIARIFDADKVQKDIDAQTQITQAFGQLASSAVGDFAQVKRTALQQQLKDAPESEKAAVQVQISELNLQERVMNVLIGAVSGMGASAVTKESLSAAAQKMRETMIENSRLFVGVTDGTSPLISNVSGQSNGVRGDQFKIGGTRIDLDLLCGVDNGRCKTIVDDNGNKQLELNSQGEVQFDPERAGVKNLAEFLGTTDEGKKLAGITGGVQGMKGSLFGEPYVAGSWQDKLVEAFAGTHDFIGGQLSGLYDAQGTIKRGMSDLERKAYDRWAEVALIPAAPFALAELLPPQVWQSVLILLGAVK